MRAVMTPGLWLQKITTKPPTRDQIDVAIASFNEVLRRERRGVSSAEAPGGETEPPLEIPPGVTPTA